MKHILVAIPFLITGLASAQLPQVQLSSVFPAGGQRGTSFSVSVSGGSDLDEVQELLFSHPGIKATISRDGNNVPQPGQFVVFIESAVPPGLYDVRVRGLFGVSNPRSFRVDTLPEAAEREPNDADAQRQSLTLNTIVNGRSDKAADVDLYRIDVTSGQTIVIRTEAASIDSVMQPTLELYSASGQRVAADRRSRELDALIVYSSPRTETLTLKVRDTVYGGGTAYQYRLIVDDRPAIDFAVPQVVQANTASEVTFFGRHMPGGVPADLFLNGQPLFARKETVQPRERQTFGTAAAATLRIGISSDIEGNLVPFALSDSPLATTAELEQDAPQTVTAPAVIAGSFGTKQDEDTYRFQAAKGEHWAIDVLADRLRTGAAPILIVEQITQTDKGESFKRLTRQDQGQKGPAGGTLPTATDDPAFELKVPADGIYQIRLKDRYFASRGGTHLRYHLVIRRSEPSFDLVVFGAARSVDGKALPEPGAVSLRRGGSYGVPVYAFRRGGHNQAIRLKAEHLPPGVTCSEPIIPAGSNSGLLVFSAADDAPETAAPVRIIGISTLYDGETTVEARTATLAHTEINGLPRTGRLAGDLVVGVMKDDATVSIHSDITHMDLTQGQQLVVPVRIARRNGFEDKVDVAITGQPKNVDVPKVSFAKGQNAALAQFFVKENAPVGPATILMHATAQVPYRRNPWQVDRAKETLAKAETQVADATRQLDSVKQESASTTAQVNALTTAITGLEEKSRNAQNQLTQLSAQLRESLAAGAQSSVQLTSLQKELVDAIGEPGTTNPDVVAIQKSAAAISAASAPISDLTQKLTSLSNQMAEQKKILATIAAEITETQKKLELQKTKAATLTKQLSATESVLKASVSTRDQAKAQLKKAEDAAKPKKLNMRQIAPPLQVRIHRSPGKLTVEVPGGGNLKKGASIDVKVTVKRQNDFSGPVTVSLWKPAEATSVTSNSVEIPPDSSTATIQITAAADAGVGGIAHAVVRATASFDGREAQFDAPITLKVTE